MNKIKLLEKIEASAKLYNKNLCNKEVLFVSDYGAFYNVIFTETNFLHFTGLKTRLSAKDFYTACLNDRIQPEDIYDDFSNFVNQKLSILPVIMSIYENARMVGSYDNTGVYLKTDKLIGNIFSSLGIKKVGKSFIPNSVIKEDIRKIAVKPISKIVLIGVRCLNEDTYTVTYRSPNCDMEKIEIETTLRFNNAEK